VRRAAERPWGSSPLTLLLLLLFSLLLSNAEAEAEAEAEDAEAGSAPPSESLVFLLAEDSSRGSRRGGFPTPAAPFRLDRIVDADAVVDAVVDAAEAEAEAFRRFLDANVNVLWFLWFSLD